MSPNEHPAQPLSSPTPPDALDAYRSAVDPESRRLVRDSQRRRNWKRWGPYLSERQWGTVREDYSPDGDCWNHFPHEHARSRAYRWGEDGILGWCDRECRLCFSIALWNERDPILKERLFGLTGPEGTCGEDVKEHYFYLDSTPTHSYARGLYKYPQRAYPYADLVQTARARTRDQGEYELTDTGVMDQSRYFDVQVQYAKGDVDDTCILISVTNRGPDAACVRLLPQLWFRNTWSWGPISEDPPQRPRLALDTPGPDRSARVQAYHPTLGAYTLHAGPGPGGESPELLFTENETNAQALFGLPGASPYVKDAFHRYLIAGEKTAVNPDAVGTKCAAHYRLTLAPGQSVSVKLRLQPQPAGSPAPLGEDFDRVIAQRLSDADGFYGAVFPLSLPPEQRHIARQAYAGLLWSKQFYCYVVPEWLAGDPAQTPPPPQRQRGRNKDWKHLYSRDVLSMPDKWEYPWFAAWDLAFHMVAMARIDPDFAKHQLLLLLREWYMHPSGAIPAYEFALDDVNPPVHAWACWRVYKMTAPAGSRDTAFLERAFQKLLINFTWWVNRKDPSGNNVFGGGFLGLDNIGVFDRSRPLPTGVSLEQADGTAWMAFFCGTMLSMALELALVNPAYEDIASKFFEHFIAIADAINAFGGTGLWDETDGFYYDHLRLSDNGEPRSIPLRVRSLVGLLPLLAVECIPQETIDRLPGFAKRMEWFLTHRPDVARYTSYLVRLDKPGKAQRLLAIPTEQRLRRVLGYMLDENEFLSPYGLRSLSRYHLEHPYVFRDTMGDHSVTYQPAESTVAIFGGNSNWRGPVWIPLNYILIEALERYHRFYGDSLKVPCPAGSSDELTLAQVASHLRWRLCQLLMKDARGARPALAGDPLFQSDPHYQDLLLFHEYFHGDTGRGLGANHQTGWTALLAPLLTDEFWLLDKQLIV